MAGSEVLHWTKNPLFQLAVVGVLGLSGCSSDQTGLGALASVRGEVTFKGDPTPGAVVELVPKDAVVSGKQDAIAVDEPRSFAVVGNDGTFEIKTFVPEGMKPGAPPGDYHIVVSWTKPLDPNDKDSSQGPDLLPVKYKDVKTSTLEYEVTSGTNQIPPLKLEP